MFLGLLGGSGGGVAGGPEGTTQRPSHIGTAPLARKDFRAQLPAERDSP